MPKPFICEQKVTTGYVGGALSLIVPIFLALTFPEFFYPDNFINNLLIWIFALGALLVLIERLSKTKYFFESVRQKNLGPFKYSIARRALMRSLGWGLIIGTLAFAYSIFPHYSGNFFKRFFSASLGALAVWGILVFPYYWITLKKISGLYWDRKDPSLLIFIFLKRLFKKNKKSVWSVFTASRATRNAWLGVVVKAFYLPLMTTFLFNNTGEFVSHFSELHKLHASDASIFSSFDYQRRFYHFIFSGAFLADVSLVVLGYALTIRWIDNGIRSVEQTALGWILALACYAPFNSFTNNYFKWPSSSFFDFDSQTLKVLIMVLIMALVSIYAWATLAFGLRFSNLTHRGILNTGPYAYVRHPAYASKLLVWWLEHLPAFTIAFSFQDFIGMSAWTLIYIGRALTEERHLSLDPDYGLYKQQVKYRFIPGVI